MVEQLGPLLAPVAGPAAAGGAEAVEAGKDVPRRSTTTRVRVQHTICPVRALMVQGTSSWAGKSLLTTALCRHFARRGVRVAPFKAQNMSNNARVVDGGEIGVAQYLQARAARVVPDVRMNPVLIKPEADTRSQVVVDGIVDHRLGATGWRERAPLLWPAIARALSSLQASTS